MVDLVGNQASQGVGEHGDRRLPLTGGVLDLDTACPRNPPTHIKEAQTTLVLFVGLDGDRDDARVDSPYPCGLLCSSTGSNFLLWLGLTKTMLGL